MNQYRTERPLPALFGDLTRDTVDLIRNEIELGRAEISQKVSQAQTGVSSIAIGAAVAMAGLVILLLAAVNALAIVLPPLYAPWLAPLIVGGVVALIGYMMLRSGQSRLTADKLVPQRTLNSLRADRAVVQEKATSSDRSVVDDRTVVKTRVVEETT